MSPIVVFRQPLSASASCTPISVAPWATPENLSDREPAAIDATHALCAPTVTPAVPK
jgi:hypothetical protein